MTLRNTSERYGTLSIALHWGMLVLFVGVYAFVELREIFPKGSDPREAMKYWHSVLGLLVLALVAVRLLVRLTSPVPRIVPAPADLQHRAAQAMHLALYALMIGMPVLGWLMQNADGKAVSLPGLGLPALIGADRDLAHTLEEVHETVGTIGYFLIGLHTAAALYHHHFVRDNTLLRMLPRRR
ncbi:MAG: cytochrome b [Gammaproteobacteria bacterium]